MAGPVLPALHSDVRFRPAGPSDALCIGVLGTQVFLDTYAPDGLRVSLAREVLAQFATATIAAQLAAPDTRCVVAEQAGHLVGFAQMVLAASHERVPAARAAKLDRLYVQEIFTGAGLGTALLGHAEAIVRADGADVLWLTAWVHNHRALAFYPRRGYADVGATTYAFDEERHENRVFAKTLAR